ncbi:hypothetical protein AVEN_71008-1 [Araneus ventricosus]|uniref:Uncharacterized protein n=1 Tax=Araneus ventricosus TaxID=182803 RepID=A0A4Y2G7A8_ARAVE|nr:hypothetical protein AVEN_71008-1 [Araneus ventricosus]
MNVKEVYGNPGIRMNVKEAYDNHGIRMNVKEVYGNPGIRRGKENMWDRFLQKVGHIVALEVLISWDRKHGRQNVQDLGYKAEGAIPNLRLFSEDLSLVPPHSI